MFDLLFAMLFYCFMYFSFFRLFLELNVYDLGSGKSIGEPVLINYSLQDGEVRHFNNRVNGSVSVAGTVSNIITPKVGITCMSSLPI